MSLNLKKNANLSATKFLKNKKKSQYENNMSFFTNSKGTEKLKEQVYQKIAACQAKIEELKQQLRLINEL